MKSFMDYKKCSCISRVLIALLLLLIPSCVGRFVTSPVHSTSSLLSFGKDSISFGSYQDFYYPSNSFQGYLLTNSVVSPPYVTTNSN